MPARRRSGGLLPSGSAVGAPSLGTSRSAVPAARVLAPGDASHRPAPSLAPSESHLAYALAYCAGFANATTTRGAAELAELARLRPLFLTNGTATPRFVTIVAEIDRVIGL